MPTGRNKAKAVTPAYVEVLILPQLSKGQRQAILEAIMACGEAMVRLRFNPDWDRCDEEGNPTYVFEGADSLPAALHASLIARNAVKPHLFFPRSDWRDALHCQRHAARAPRPPAEACHLHLV